MKLIRKEKDYLNDQKFKVYDILVHLAAIFVSVFEDMRIYEHLCVLRHSLVTNVSLSHEKARDFWSTCRYVYVKKCGILKGIRAFFSTEKSSLSFFGSGFARRDLSPWRTSNKKINMEKVKACRVSCLFSLRDQ